MPLRALDDGRSVLANEVMESAKRHKFFCPSCKDNMSFVDAIVKIKHFRHKTKCKYRTEPESELHLEMKHYMYNTLTQIHGKVVELEPIVADRIPDLSFTFNGVKYAVECQCSSISSIELQNRTSSHKSAGYNTIWIFKIPKFDENEKYITITSAMKIFYNKTDVLLFYSEGKLYKVNLFPTYRWRGEYPSHRYKKWLKMKFGVSNKTEVTNFIPSTSNKSLNFAWFNS